jgi:hypothetical protein
VTRTNDDDTIGVKKVTSPKKPSSNVNTSSNVPVVLEVASSPNPISPNVNSTDVPILAPVQSVPKPTYEGVLIDNVLVGLRFIPANTIYQYDKIDAKDTRLTGVVTSEMLYVAVGEDRGEGGYEKIKVYRNDKRSTKNLSKQAWKARKSRTKREGLMIENEPSYKEMPPAYFPSSGRFILTYESDNTTTLNDS